MVIKDEINLQQPLVSIITPTYNRLGYLKEALASAVNQTYRNIEVIVSDNCSPENPQALVESFADSRIRFSRNETNIGMFANTFKAFQMARGKYVAALLDDDVWEPDFLEKLIPPLEAHPDLSVAFCDHYIIDAQGVIDDKATQEYSSVYKRSDLQEGIYQPFYRLALVDNAVSTATAAVIRHDAIAWDKIPAEVGGSWDIYLNYLCCRSGAGAYYYPAKLTRYRSHENTDTNQSGSANYQAKIRKAKADIFCYEQFMADENLQELRSHFQERWGHINTTLGIGLLRAKLPQEARPYFWRSLNHSFSWRTIAGLLLSFTSTKVTAKF
ncbi:glycosyltransferase family 2 protein [Calothrix sp. UHCC 0171]|uniref:glycosyltransferase family 2 protein n=1 Tax=Calothrix sp. UHCC 0171 TaxID=3110245 RepID=UPI002B2076B6|nr:glycosyltransferase family 2 protein [Calothrix sp. UHCC 0171]MEA5571604.1 glycosyltransferase family 2 protein [Calothrix sp. UHCC 0171]